MAEDAILISNSLYAMLAPVLTGKPDDRRLDTSWRSAPKNFSLFLREFLRSSDISWCTGEGDDGNQFVLTIKR